MKQIVKKNQIIIAALAVMIAAAAGYLNYSGKIFGDKKEAETANADLASKELLDISEEDLASASDDIKSQDGGEEDGSVDGTPGEAVLTSGDASAVVAEAKVSREQVRAKNKESLLEIIDNESLTEEQKQDAINQMVAMTDLAEKEAAAETLLASKGFDEVVISLTADTAVSSTQVSDSQRAQIEDIVARKTGVAAQNIVITPVNTEGK